MSNAPPVIGTVFSRSIRDVFLLPARLFSFSQTKLFEFFYREIQLDRQVSNDRFESFRSNALQSFFAFISRIQALD